jgi:hypothetical protein
MKLTARNRVLKATIVVLAIIPVVIVWGIQTNFSSPALRAIIELAEGNTTTTIFKTKNCVDFSLQFLQLERVDWLNGSDYMAEIHYIGHNKNEIISHVGSGPGGNTSFSEQAPYPVKNFPIRNGGENEYVNGKQVYRIKMYVDPAKFSKEDFEDMAGCAEKNLPAFETALNDPRVQTNSFYHLELAGIAYQEWTKAI